MTTMTEQETIRVLREALEDMGNPIAAMKREVPEGSVLNPHMAVQMAGDPEWYKRRAREALAATATIQPVAAEQVTTTILIDANTAMSLIEAGALRQYRHNDGSDGFVFGYDKTITDRVFASLAAPEPVMADGKTRLSDYLEDALSDGECGDQWTKGYEECKRLLFKVVGAQLRAAPRALELALGALIAAQPRDISPKGWERHEQAINAAGCALNKPTCTIPAPQAAPEPSYWMSVQHGEFKVSYTDDSDTAYKWFPVWTHPIAPQAAPEAPPPGDSSNPVYWYAVLVKCARLLDLPVDEPIPSGVLRAIEKLTDTPSTEATRQCLDKAKRGQSAEAAPEAPAIAQHVWIVNDDKGEPVMLCPQEPSAEMLAELAVKIGKSVEVKAYLLFPAATTVGASIGDDPNFRQMLLIYAYERANESGAMVDEETALQNLIAHIDIRAQAPSGEATPLSQVIQTEVEKWENKLVDAETALRNIEAILARQGAPEAPTGEQDCGCLQGQCCPVCDPDAYASAAAKVSTGAAPKALR